MLRFLKPLVAIAFVLVTVPKVIDAQAGRLLGWECFRGDVWRGYRGEVTTSTSPVM